MGSIASNAQTIARKMQKRITGEAVAYKRGETSISITLASRGSTVWDVASPETGIMVEERSVDWLIDAADLGDLVPARNDIITASGIDYKVMPFGEGSTIWRWHDREARTVYRIHTKERA